MTNFYGRTSDLAERRALNAYRLARAAWYARVLEQSRHEDEETLALAALLGEERLTVETINAVWLSSRSVEARRKIYSERVQTPSTTASNCVPHTPIGRTIFQ
ncbi:hypothetical protein HAP47_0000340 [Bradyrhizobium sp. 41S5]|uniref:hypothetical protein n=1 Tax=Bradyrhizobium sp. 41S5 TaxID=1404443 RepID=UPI00156B113B|nr:hypothetical protein [Bradyrhizobium sp. 41S5]UFX45226.1 hypothetical protein HAP47_0000340 [Bradyrhizobium sp. 41S5]